MRSAEQNDQPRRQEPEGILDLLILALLGVWLLWGLFVGGIVVGYWPPGGAADWEFIVVTEAVEPFALVAGFIAARSGRSLLACATVAAACIAWAIPVLAYLF